MISDASMEHIPFNIPPIVGNEYKFLEEAISNNKLCGDGPFGKSCEKYFVEKLNCPKVLLTPNCTQALEMAAILAELSPGDEVIMPSYTFVSTANAFVLRGARIKFVDIRADTMNIDETKIEEAITPRTKMIVPVHYAGVACEMDTIMALSHKYNLCVVEDAAQGMMSSYKGRPLGTIGHLGAFSFHETKNYTSGGEGGLLIINDDQFSKRAEIIREKGTNRSQFFRGKVDKYSWVDIGSSYLPSELQAAFLWGQLIKADKINAHRLSSWNTYKKSLLSLSEKGVISLPSIPEGCTHNAHMFYIKVNNIDERTLLMNYLSEKLISSVFHYIPLHSSEAGQKLGTFIGPDIYTTKESERLLRLPLFYGITESQIERVVSEISLFYAEI